LGVAMRVSSPRAIIRQARDGRNRAASVGGSGLQCKKSPALAARLRNDTMGCLVWFAALVCSIEYLGENSVHKVIIIGSGCAGLTAAIYAARADLQPLVLDGSFWGRS
jgi:hypothetical protein